MDQNITMKATSSALKGARRQLKTGSNRTECGVKFINAFHDIESGHYYAVNAHVPHHMYIHVLVEMQPAGYSFDMYNRTFRAPHDDVLDEYMQTIHPGDIWTIIGRRGTRTETQTYIFRYGNIQFEFESII
jgi:hypothetical protein